MEVEENVEERIEKKLERRLEDSSHKTATRQLKKISLFDNFHRRQVGMVKQHKYMTINLN